MRISKKSYSDLEKLAYDLTKLADNFDPYGFMDAYDDFNDGYEDIFYTLENGIGIDNILYELDRIIEECSDSDNAEDREYLREANRLYRIVKSM